MRFLLKLSVQARRVYHFCFDRMHHGWCSLSGKDSCPTGLTVYE